jgi:hypothetical protein
MAKLSTLLLAALLDSPALYHAFVTHDMDYTSALTRYLIAVVAAAVMLWLLREMMNAYRRVNDAERREAEAEAREADAEARAADAEARVASREATQEAALEALDVARANPALMAEARRSTDAQAADEAVG